MRFLNHIVLLVAVLASCSEPASEPTEVTAPRSNEMNEKSAEDPKPTSAPTAETATLGAGCFWCVEAVLLQVDGVLGVESGYMGGHVDDPTYEQVCTKTTGHVEVVQVRFDPKKLSYAQLLQWFWRLHDPTTKDRQGNDEGPQYRSAIFYHSEEQRELAEASKLAADGSGECKAPIVTVIEKATRLWVAEGYHQDYYRQNKSQGYCRYVIAPKLDKLGLDK